ncbi:hypothetical protein VKT23_015136 [Stygiomarasmius scandens]|uniref:RING-type E3 ubiquitin transferase n=1 Tax=Marasmiellus scandens TaxID=2682957 RepID=A0ABR1IYU0_9AGAR
MALVDKTDQEYVQSLKIQTTCFLVRVGAQDPSDGSIKAACEHGCYKVKRRLVVCVVTKLHSKSVSRPSNCPPILNVFADYKDNVPSKLPAFISLFEIAKRLSYTIARVFRATTISLIWIITVPLVAISALRLLWRAVPSNVHALAGSYVTQVDRTSLGIELINGQVLCLALLLGYLFLWLCARWVQIVELPITPGRMAPLPPVPPLRNNLPLEPPPLVPSPLGLRPTDLSEHNIVPATEFQNSQRSKWHADADPQAQKEVGRQRQGLQEYDDRLLERKKLHLEGVTVDQLVEGNGKSSLKFASARSNDQVKYLDRRFLKAKNLLPRDGPIMIEAEDVLVERAASRRFTLRIQMTKSIARRSRNRRQVLPNAKACTNFENTAVSSVVSLPDVTFSPRKPIPYPLAPSLINEQPAEGLASGVIVSNTWDIEQRDSPNASMQKDSERASNCPVPSNHPVPNNRSVSGDRPVPHLQFPPEVLLAGVPPIPERPDWNAPIQHQMRQPILGLTRVFRDMVIVIKGPSVSRYSGCMLNDTPLVLAINGQIYSVLCQAYFITFMATAGLGLSIWTAHSIGRALLYMLGVITSGPWDQTLAVCVGYLLIFLASLVTLHLRSSTLNESSRRKLRNLKV